VISPPFSTMSAGFSLAYDSDLRFSVLNSQSRLTSKKTANEFARFLFASALLETNVLSNFTCIDLSVIEVRLFMHRELVASRLRRLHKLDSSTVSFRKR